MNRKIGFFIHTVTYFPELFRIALSLKSQKKFVPEFYFSFYYPTIEEDITRCKQNNIPVYTYENIWPRGKIIFIIKTIHHQFHNLFFVKLLAAKLKLNFYYKFIKNRKYSLVILAGDIVWYDTPLIIHAAHKNNIKAVVIPSWVANEKEAAESIYHSADYDYNRYPNKIVGNLFPKWVLPYKEKMLVKSPWNEILIHEILHLSPPLPWILHSGYSDAIALESNFMCEFCVREGLPPDKLTITGSLANDNLVERLSNKTKYKKIIYRKYHLHLKKRFLLSALPPDMLVGFGARVDCQFKKYEQLVKFWVKSFNHLKNFNSIISLHPSVTEEQMDELTSKYNCTFTRESIIKMIPCCDVFVASASSTIQWALACAKPVIQYDIYKYRYGDYLKEAGVLHTEIKEEFLKFLHRIDSNTQYLRLEERAKKNSNYWGKMDGKSSQRIIKLFESMIET